jgi:thioesterase domain-containing protein
MAASYLSQVLAIWPDGPYYFAGFSFGGVLAFEMALQLQASGKDVPFLVLIDSISPLAKEQVRWHRNLYRIVRSNILRPIKMELIRSSKLALCKSYLLFKMPLPVTRRHFYMLEKYRVLTGKYRPAKYNGKILLFRTVDNRSSYNYLGWETLTDSIRYVTLAADHTTVFENEQSAGVLKTEFANYLSQVSDQNL